MYVILLKIMKLYCRHAT